MNGSQLHAFVLRELEPIVDAASDRMSQKVGKTDDDSKADFLIAAGRHEGARAVIGALLALVEQMLRDEAERASASELYG